MPSKHARTPTATPHPVRPAELARRLGRARSTVTELLNGSWREARLPSGRVDAAHPVIAAAARARGIDPRALLDAPRSAGAAKSKPEGAKRSGPKSAPVDQNLEALLDMRLRDVNEAFGSSQAFRDWITARKLVAETERVESRNDRDAGRLVSKELIRSGVFTFLNTLAKSLLNDMPKTIALRVRSQLPREESEKLISDLLGAQIAHAKERVLRGLRAAQIPGNVEPPEVHDETGSPRDSAGPPERESLPDHERH